MFGKLSTIHYASMARRAVLLFTALVLLAGLYRQERAAAVRSDPSLNSSGSFAPKKQQYRVVRFMPTMNDKLEQYFVGDIIDALNWKSDRQNELRIKHLGIGYYDGGDCEDPLCDRLTVDLEKRSLRIKCWKEPRDVPAQKCDARDWNKCAADMLEHFAGLISEHHKRVHGGN